MNGKDWNIGGWSKNCDFPKMDFLEFITTDYTKCSETCAFLSGCTAYSFSNSKCNLKYGLISKTDAKKTISSSTSDACGIVSPSPLTSNQFYF